MGSSRIIDGWSSVHNVCESLFGLNNKFPMFLICALVSFYQSFWGSNFLVWSYISSARNHMVRCKVYEWRWTCAWNFQCPALRHRVTITLKRYAFGKVMMCALVGSLLLTASVILITLPRRVSCRLQNLFFLQCVWKCHPLSSCCL